MTRAELQSFLPGTNVTHTNKGGSLRRWTNEADGTLVASTQQQGKYGSAYGTSSVSAPGTWIVDEKGKYCIQIDWKREEEKWCSSILKAGDSYYLGSVDPRKRSNLPNKARQPAGEPSVEKKFPSRGCPRRFVGLRWRIQLGRCGSGIVHPFAQQRRAVDQVDGQPVELVFVGEVAPQRVVGIQPPDGLEGERLQAPGLEGGVIVVRRLRTWICTPLHSLPACLWKVGSNQNSRSLQPLQPVRREGAAFRRCTARASMSGAPKSSSGRVVPRPSDSVVPSSITVPA